MGAHPHERGVACDPRGRRRLAAAAMGSCGVDGAVLDLLRPARGRRAARELAEEGRRGGRVARAQGVPRVGDVAQPGALRSPFDPLFFFRRQPTDSGCLHLLQFVAVNELAGQGWIFTATMRRSRWESVRKAVEELKDRLVKAQA